MPKSSEAIESLLRKTNQCVLCGLCAPHCPTYALQKQEPDAPRGRLSLMRAASLGQLIEKDLSAVERCLGCGRCESVCPAEVPYMAILDTFRAVHRQKQWFSPVVWLENLGQWFLEKPKRLQKVWPWLRPFARLWPRTRTVANFPQKTMRYDNFYPATGAVRGEVAIFLGCVSRVWQGEALTAGIKLLQNQGFAVHIPEAQGCCGALAAHCGNQAGANACQQQNQAAFAALLPKLTAILTIDSGCGQYLHYQAKTETFNLKVKDLLTFLLEQETFRHHLASRTWPEGTLLHVPCSQENRGGELLREALQKLPQLPAGCCGAAGSYFLKQPKMARALRQQLWQQRPLNTPTQILTSNIGCALHWADLGQGERLAVVHPLVFIARVFASAAETISD
jgi:glycolate oxidase iron-sulfur subunit